MSYVDHHAPDHVPCDICTGRAHEVTGRIIAVDRLANSRNGNPRFAVTLEFTALGTITQTWNTRADHAFAYEIAPYGYYAVAAGPIVELELGYRAAAYILGSAQ